MKLKEYRLAAPEEVNKAKSLSGIVGGGILKYPPDGINPSFVFKVLSETFGLMNSCDPGEKSSWEWIFKTDKFILTVYDYNGTWSIGYIGEKPDIWEEIEGKAVELKEAIAEEVKKIKFSKQQIKEAKIGGVISNPYSIYSNTSLELLQEARKILGDIKNKESECKTSLDKMENFYKSANRSIAIFSLYQGAFLTNYLALEGFINLIYSIFLNKRYKTDYFERMFERKQILEKVLEMDRYCGDLTTPVLSETDELYKAFHYLTNVRNTFLHANICQGMQSHLVNDKDLPLMIDEKEETKFGIRNHPTKITNHDVIHAQRIVNKIVIKTLLSMSDRIREAFTIVHKNFKIPYLINDEGEIYIHLKEEDYVPAEELEKIFSESLALDSSYYDITEEEYVPPYSRMY